MSQRFTRENIHQGILFFLLALVAVGMQFSHFLVSLGIILLAANFLAEGRFGDKWAKIKSNPSIYLFVGFFLLHLLGLLWTTDFDFAFRDIKIKLPILALPLVLGAGTLLKPKQFHWILILFIATSLLSSIIGSVIYFILSQPGDDYRNMSPFMSHIRLSLMMGTAMFSSFYLGQKTEVLKPLKSIFIGLGVWFLVYLFMLRAMSGIVAVLAAALVIVWLYTNSLSSIYKHVLRGLIASTILLIGLYIYQQIDRFYQFDEISIDQVEKKTPRGEDYVFYLDIPLVENGHFVYSYIAYSELETSWNEVSEIPFKGLDKKGQQIEPTLIRYLTSKNLRKDKDGISQLTHLDIWAIENGIANERFLDSKSLNNLTYRYIWEVHNYLSGFSPQGNSFGQRFLFWKIGLSIWKEHFFTGVGTGDLQLAFNAKYDSLPFEISNKYRLRAHNQYLTIGIAFGVFGLAYFVLTLFSGWFTSSNGKTFLFVSFFSILLVSMLDEDTLETQYGVTFSMYFYFLFLFHQPKTIEQKT